MHPIALWAGSWAFSTVLYALRLLPYRSLSWLTTGLICGAVAAFAVGASIGVRVRPRRAPRGIGERAQAVEMAAWLLVALLAVTLLAFLAGLVSRFGLAHVLRISPTVKLYLSGGEAPLSSMYIEIAIAAAAMCALAAGTVRAPSRRRWWLVATIACASTIYFSTSRAFIIVALAAALAAYLSVEVKVNRRRLTIGAVLAVAIALAVFTGLGALLGKTYGNSSIGEFDNFFARHEIARPLALPYQDATASIAALDLLTGVSSTWGVAHGCATVPIVCGALRKLGVHALRVPVTGPFTAAPLQWNGYTFLDRYLIDFGTALTLVLVAITGALAAYLWRRAREGSLGSTIVYAISVPALLAAYRQNLVEIVLIASIIAVSILLLCSSVLSTGLVIARKPGLGRMNRVLQRRMRPAPERIAGALLEAGPVASAPVAGTGGWAAKLRGAMHTRPQRRERACPDRRARKRLEQLPRPRPELRVSTRAEPRAARRLEPRAPVGAKQQEAGRGVRRQAIADSPQRVAVAGRIPKTKEECERYARYVWAARLVHGSVLDVACGNGYGARLLARSAHVTGLDRDQGAVEQARARVNGHFSVAEVPPIPVRPFAFDFVVSFDALEHTQDEVEFVREISRVLGPTGTLLLSIPNADISDENESATNPWHARGHTWGSLTALLENAGLKVVGRYMQGFPPLFPRGHRFTGRIQGFTWVLPRGMRFATRALLGDAQVRRFKPRKRAPAYLLVVAKRRH